MTPILHYLAPTAAALLLFSVVAVVFCPDVQAMIWRAM